VRAAPSALLLSAAVGCPRVQRGCSRRGIGRAPPAGWPVPAVSPPSDMAAPAGQDLAGDPRRWLILGVVLVGTFIAIVDVSIVNVAVPAIRRDLHASYGAVEFVVAAYVLAYGVLLITGGRLGDIYGRRRLFLTGLAIFTIASALCGVAPTAPLLIGARAVQGVGGALMYPQVLAIIRVTFSGADLNRALGIFGSVIGGGLIAGQVIGGALISLNLAGLTWRPVFLVNVPVGAAGFAAAVVVLRAGERTRTRLDLGGVALITLAMLALVIPLIAGRDAGWPGWIIAILAAAPALFAVFYLFEARRSRAGGVPLVDVTLFGQRAFVVGLGIAIAFFAANAGFLFLFAVYLQAGLGFSPIAAGLTYTPAAAGLLVTSLAAPRLIPLLGRRVLSVGYGIAALGYLATTAVVAAAGATVRPLELAPVLLIVGLGQGLGITPLMGTVLSGVAPRQAGAASGVLTTALQVGNVLGISVFSLAFFAFLGTPVAGGRGGAYAAAYAATLPAAAALTLAAFVLVRLLPTPRAQSANVLVERAGGWAPGLAYSLFLATGGRIGEHAFAEILGGVIDRRTQLTRQAPADPGDFLAYQFTAGAGDHAWRNFLTREALSRGDHPVAHEDERRPVIQAQVGDIRRRQADGLIDPDLDPALVRLMAFALATYPRIFRQITRMTTGLPPDDPRFAAAWSAFLRELGRRLAPGEQHAPASAPGRDRTHPATPGSQPPDA